MVKKTILLFAFFTVLTLFAGVDDGSVRWYTDFDKALEMARKQHKPLFVFFTGKGWCGHCKDLNDNVLETYAFKDFSENVVLLEINIPRDGFRTKEENDRIEEIQREYNGFGLPTIAIINPDTKDAIYTDSGYDSSLMVKDYIDTWRAKAAEYNK